MSYQPQGVNTKSIILNEQHWDVLFRSFSKKEIHTFPEKFRTKMDAIARREIRSHLLWDHGWVI